MTLWDALHMKSVVKLDMISLVDNQFFEVNNFYILVEKNPINGKLTPINLDPSYTNPSEFPIRYEIEVKKQIEELYYSNLNYSPFKMVKRMWALSRLLKKEHILRKLYKLVTGDISFLYQLISQIENIIRISELKKKPIKHIEAAIDLIKYKLANILLLDNDDLVNINKFIKSFMKKHDFGILRKIINYLKEIVNRATIIELNKIGYNPPPREFLPEKMKYLNRTVIVSNMNDNGERYKSLNPKFLGGSQQIRRVYFSNENPYIGDGLADNFIASLPFELHMLGTVHKEPYQSMDKSLKNYKES